ncbi:hypothetical protein ACH5RR_023734 [Cinchona calisaya]|uniref:Pentatricopeptide repeat-containing protein n=1 Tax=Cinchona calisaya TaxID=153742 RepID=A0ABD2ZEM9_9GENT
MLWGILSGFHKGEKFEDVENVLAAMKEHGLSDQLVPIVLQFSGCVSYGSQKRHCLTRCLRNEALAKDIQVWSFESLIFVRETSKRRRICTRVRGRVGLNRKANVRKVRQLITCCRYSENNEIANAVDILKIVK